jgi:glycosyltransferase involved in cell wall biosynthesis
VIVSIVIPCRNEEKHIAECVRSIYNSKLEAGINLEVFVVDGMSDDGTIEVINELKNEFSSLDIIPNLAKVTPVAFNLGIKKAKGAYIQIIGARQLVSDNYIQEGVNSLRGDSNIWCVGGVVENVYQTSESEMIGKAMASSFGVGAGNFRVIKKSVFTDTVGTPMYPAEVFDKIGLFDESLVRNQDDELNFRISKLGGKILLNANMFIKYFVRAK